MISKGIVLRLYPNQKQAALIWQMFGNATFEPSLSTTL